MSRPKAYNKSFSLMPLPEGSKAPVGTEWTSKASPVYAVIPAGSNVGVRITQGLCIVDVDVKGGAKGRTTYLEWERDLGIDLKQYITVKTPSGGVHLYFTVPTNRTARFKEDKLNHPGIEILSGLSDWEVEQDPTKDCRYHAVGAGSVVKGKKYVLADGVEPGFVPPEMPEALLNLLYLPVGEEEAHTPSRECYGDPSTNLKDARRYLKRLDSDDRERWYRVGLILARSCGELARELFHTWSKTSPEKYNKVKTDKWYSGALADKRVDRTLSMATLNQWFQEVIGVEQDEVKAEVASKRTLYGHSLEDLMTAQWYRMAGAKNNRDTPYYSRLFPTGVGGHDLDTYARQLGYYKLQREKVYPPGSFLDYLVENCEVDTRCSRTVVRPYDERMLIDDDPDAPSTVMLNIFDRRIIDTALAFELTQEDIAWCEAYLGYLLKHFVGLASGNVKDGEAAYWWYLNAIQLKERLPYSLILTTNKGSGKTTLADIARKVITDNFFATITSDFTTGRYRDKIVGKLFVMGVEMHEVGTSVKSGDGVLKALITDETISVEAKYEKAVDYSPACSVLMASNDIHFVNYTRDERRYLGLICDAEDVEDFVKRYGEPGDDKLSYYARLRELYKPDDRDREKMNRRVWSLRAYLWGDHLTTPLEYSGAFPYKTSFHDEFVAKSCTGFEAIKNSVKELVVDVDSPVYPLVNEVWIDQRALAKYLQEDNGTFGTNREDPNVATVSKAIGSLHAPGYTMMSIRVGSKIRKVWRSKRYDAKKHQEATEMFKDAFAVEHSIVVPEQE